MKAQKKLQLLLTSALSWDIFLDVLQSYSEIILLAASLKVDLSMVRLRVHVPDLVRVDSRQGRQLVLLQGLITGRSRRHYNPNHNKSS